MSVNDTERNEILSCLALGDYTGAKEALGDLWIGPGNIPAQDGLDHRDYASLVMLCGILTVELGLMGGHLQEKGKDMLSLSVRLFGDDSEGAQIARSWLGIAYERCGDFNEVLALADVLLASEDSNLEVAVCAAKSRSIAFDGLGYPEKALEALSDIAGISKGVGALLQGKIALQRGNVLRKIGQQNDALESFQLAGEKFSEARSPRYEASASNNIASIHMDRGEFAQAHVLTEKAIRLFQSIGDRVHEGAAWDQSAQISRTEGKLDVAERSARKAISLLEQGDRLDYLAEAYTTLGTILFQVGAEGAALPLQKAAAIYEQTGNAVLLNSVNGILWDSVLRIKRVAKDAKTAIYQAVRPIEQRIIAQVLEKHSWRILPAARELKLTHRGLSEMLRKHFPELYAKLPPTRSRTKNRSIITK